MDLAALVLGISTSAWLQPPALLLLLLMPPPILPSMGVVATWVEAAATGTWGEAVTAEVALAPRQERTEVGGDAGEEKAVDVDDDDDGAPYPIMLGLTEAAAGRTKRGCLRRMMRD